MPNVWAIARIRIMMSRTPPGPVKPLKVIIGIPSIAIAGQSIARLPAIPYKVAPTGATDVQLKYNISLLISFG